MEQRNLSSEVEEISDLFNKIAEKAGEVSDKRNCKLKVLQADSKALQNLLESLSEKDDQEMLPEMQRVQAKLASSAKELEKLYGLSGSLRDQVHQAKQMVQSLQKQHLKQKSQMVQPRSRYSVNVFRDMSNINWQPVHEPNEIKGFVSNKMGTKTFCFNKEKQSSFFIANSLWEMGEDESDDETPSRGGRGDSSGVKA